MGVECMLDTLNLGDFVWVAREKTQKDFRHLEQRRGLMLVLDHVLERKRMDDLASSIMDGRYVDQKYRFKKASFIRNPIYLVEDYGTDKWW